MARAQIMKKEKESQELQLDLIWKQLPNETVVNKNITLKNSFLWEFSCGFCEAEYAVKWRIVTGRKSKPWLPIAVVLEDFYQRWNRTANYVLATLFYFFYILCFICLLYYSVNSFLMTSILLPNNIDLKNTIKLISSLQLKFICLISPIQFK